EQNTIYNKPNNKFVVNFIGHSKIMEGTIQKKEEKTLFQSEPFTFEVAAEGMDTTARHTAVIRPERSAISDTGTLKGEITKVVYNGNFSRYFVDLNGTEILVDQYNKDATTHYKEGDKLTLEMPKDPHYLQE